MSGLRLIVGLGNPGRQYEATRHNIGERWLRALAARFDVTLAAENRFKGQLGRGDLLGHDVRLLVPTTFMNNSGESVGAVTRFYKIDAAETLVVYDEVAFPVGVAKLKIAGSDAGHNGIKSVIAGMGNDPGFARLRIGVGHPGHPARMVAFLTGVTMPAAERDQAEQAAYMDDQSLTYVLACDWQKAMTRFHAPALDEDTRGI